MNILLLNPPFRGRFSRASRSPAVAKGGTLYYPLWLAYAAGVLEKEGFRVRLVDAPAEGWSAQDVTAKLKGFSPRLIVLDTSTPSLSTDVKMGESLKEEFPEGVLVLVGTHVSALPEETLRFNRKIDGVARREYDFTLRDLAKALQEKRPLESVSGLSWRHGESIVHNPDRPFITNLDELPFVSSVYQKHLNIRNYFFAAARHPMVMIISGRGCPHRCTFCVYPQTFHGHRYRCRSPENVVAEFDWIVRNLPRVREIGIEDDTFTADLSRVRRIAELLIQKKIRVGWYCNVRPDVDYSTLRIMKQAGCRLVTVGFESGSQELLDGVRKGLKLDRIRQFREDARRAGILVHGCIIIGNPGETRETIRESLRWAREMSCDSMQFYPLFVYPGTVAFERAKKEGYLTTGDYSQWVTAEGFHNCVVQLPGLHSEEIVRICDRALRNYHFSPSYLWMKFRQAVRAPVEGLRTARSALAYIKSLRPRRLRY